MNEQDRKQRPGAGATPRNPPRGVAPDHRPATGAQPQAGESAVDSRTGASGTQPDLMGRPGAAASARPGEGRRGDAQTRQGASAAAQDIPDDYGQETSNPDDLEPRDDHERG